MDTGIYTGRSPQDKYFVEREPSKSNIWWSPIPPNKPVSEKVFNEVYDDVKQYMNGKEVYVFDGYCGANPKSRKCVRFVTEYAWQHHFVTNMFVRPKSVEELKNFKPEFTVINTCKGLVNKNWKRQGLNSEAFVGFDINMVGMAAVAVAIALIIWQLRSEQAAAAPQVAAASDDEWED